MQFCLAQTTNTTCLANAGTIHMCTTTSTGGCISLRGHSEPIACVVDYQKAKSTGANATLANGTAACEIAERIFRPCYDYTNQSDCAAATGCSWNAANPSAINYDICFPTDLPDSKDAVLAELNATWVPAIKAQDDLCRTLLPATNCQAAIMPVSIPPVIPLYKQCGGAGGGCTRWVVVHACQPGTLLAVSLNTERKHAATPQLPGLITHTPTCVLTRMHAYAGTSHPLPSHSQHACMCTSTLQAEEPCSSCKEPHTAILCTVSLTHIKPSLAAVCRLPLTLHHSPSPSQLHMRRCALPQHLLRGRRHLQEVQRVLLAVHATSSPQARAHHHLHYNYTHCYTHRVYICHPGHLNHDHFHYRQLYRGVCCCQD